MYFYALDCGPFIYCGRTGNLKARLRQHITGKGAKLTRNFYPRDILYYTKVAGVLGAFADKLERVFARHIAYITKRSTTTGQAPSAKRVKSEGFDLWTMDNDEWFAIIGDEVDENQPKTYYPQYGFIPF